MLRAALMFFLLAIIAMVLGANGVAGLSVEVGKMLLVVFLVLAVISTVAGLVGGRNTRILP